MSIFKAVAIAALPLSIMLNGCSRAEESSAEPEQATPSGPNTDDPNYWIDAFESNQAAHSYEYLMNCWHDQWPEGVKAAFNAPSGDMATETEKADAIVATRENCEVQMLVAIDQIKIDLVREGVPVSDIEEAAQQQLNVYLEDMFDEYWARL